jgi:hypothetical protein
MHCLSWSQVFLNDWSFASHRDVIVDFRGNRQCAPDEILQLLASTPESKSVRYTASAAHDLETVVKLVYCLRHNSWPVVQDNSADLLKFWTVHLNSYGWQEIVQAARAANYVRLRALISERAFPPRL